MKARVFTKYPFLFFVLAAVLLLNNYLHFAPLTISGKNLFIVSGVLIFMGAMGYAMKIIEKKKAQ